MLRIFQPNSLPPSLTYWLPPSPNNFLYSSLPFSLFPILKRSFVSLKPFSYPLSPPSSLLPTLPLLPLFLPSSPPSPLLFPSLSPPPSLSPSPCPPLPSASSQRSLPLLLHPLRHSSSRLTQIDCSPFIIQGVRGVKGM